MPPARLSAARRSVKGVKLVKGVEVVKVALGGAGRVHLVARREPRGDERERDGDGAVAHCDAVRAPCTGEPHFQ
jgi:uncharacterized protein YbjT (DUF2867 family)